MPEVQEVFRMATQKVRQAPGAMDRQVAKQRTAARNRRIGVFAMVLALVAALVATYAITRGRTPEIPGNVTTISIGAGAGPSKLIDLATGEVTPLPGAIAAVGAYYAVSPDGTKVAYNACCSPPAPLLVANIDGTNAHILSKTGADAHGAHWSSDGSLIVYQQRDASTLRLGDLFVVGADGGNRTRLTNFDQTQRWGWWFLFPSFAPDGQSVLFHLPRGDQHHPSWDLWSVPVAGGEPTIVRRNAGWGDYSDGGALAYVSSMGGDFTGDTLWIASSDGGAPTPVARGQISWPRWSPDGTQISFQNGGSIWVLDVATGSTTRIAPGSNAEWANDHTLIIGSGGS